MALVERLGWGGAAVQTLRGLVAEPLEPDPLSPPRHVEEQVGGDPVQPAFEGPRGVAGQRAENADEDLLGQILRVVLVAGQPVSQPVYPRRMGTDDLFPARWRPPGGSRIGQHVLVHGLGHPLPVGYLPLITIVPGLLFHRYCPSNAHTRRPGSRRR